MNYAVVGQTLRINATLDLDISTATAVAIKYRKPAGTSASLTATKTGAYTCYADVPAATLDSAGDWLFLAEATFSDGSKAKTYGVTVRVLAEFAPLAP